MFSSLYDTRHNNIYIYMQKRSCTIDKFRQFGNGVSCLEPFQKTLGGCDTRRTKKEGKIPSSRESTDSPTLYIRVRVGNGCNVIPWACEWKRVELCLFGCSSSCSATDSYFLTMLPLQPNSLGMYSKLSCTIWLGLEALGTWVCLGTWVSNVVKTLTNLSCFLSLGRTGY